MLFTQNWEITFLWDQLRHYCKLKGDCLITLSCDSFEPNDDMLKNFSAKSSGEEEEGNQINPFLLFCFKWKGQKVFIVDALF